MKRLILLFTITACDMQAGRSMLRPVEPTPTITTRWLDDTQTYRIKDSHLEEGPLFKTFDKTFFFDHIIPNGPITFRNHPQQSVTGAQLSSMIERLITELQEHRHKFTDFIVIKDLEFNYRSCCGLFIARFKKYPFVVKLFIETPQSFVQPFSKGFEPCCFFVMSGGIMRHLTGFTRVQNLEAIQQMVSADPYWFKVIDTPRKWHWVPKHGRWFEVRGTNIGNQGELRTELPSTYAVVADEITVDKKRTIFNQEHAQRCMKFCQYTHYRIDPHIKNFMVEKETGKLVLIDTENFRALVGLKDRFIVESYVSWYVRLSTKYLKDGFFRTKRDRLSAQRATSWEYDIS